MNIPKMEMRCWRCRRSTLVVWQSGEGWYCYDCLPPNIQEQLIQDASLSNDFGASVRAALELAKLRFM